MIPAGSIRAVVFDLDGLMVDTEPIFTQAAQRLLSRRGHALTAEMQQVMMGTPARQTLQAFCDHYGLSESIEDLSKEGFQLFFEILGERRAPLLPGVLELLDRLERQNIPKAIATSSSAAYVERVLGPHALLPRFKFVLTADDVRLGKPFPEVYEKAAARLNLPAANMLVLEDSVNGLRAAKAAGARCIVVPHELVARDRLADADAVLSSLEDPVLYEIMRIS